MNGYRRSLARLAAQYGYAIQPEHRKHLKLRPLVGQGRLIVAAASPSDGLRVLRNIESDLRRAAKCNTTLDTTPET